MHAGVLLHAALADEALLAVLALELLGGVVQSPVHLQAVLVGEGLVAHLARVRPHARVVQHVDPKRVQLGHRLAADVAHELPLGVRRQRPLVQIVVGGRRLAERRPLAALLLVSRQVGAQRGRVLELFAAQLRTREHGGETVRTQEGANEGVKRKRNLRCTCSREPSRVSACA